MELIYYLIFLDRDKMDVYWDKTSCFLHNPLDQSKDAPNDEHSSVIKLKICGKKHFGIFYTLAIF